ncbi:hypothetical protein NVP1191O_18 [Vibrio phage 1.191.O._10N.286.52.B4]|nr:hypothetical protein NVP1191O_18 [Vibrio phage 1.191.O._10N.286.52.B4]
MIVFIDVKVAETVVSVGDESFSLIPVTHKWLKGELRGLYELFAKGGSIEGVDIDFKGGEYPSFFIDAGFLNEEVIKFVETCEIPNVYAIKLMPEDLKILATSGKQQRSPGKVTDSNTLTMRLIQHSIIASEQKDSIDRQPSQLTHQETTDRINALGYALGALNDSMGTLPFNGEHASAIDSARFAISDELSLLTNQPKILGQAKVKKTIGEHIEEIRKQNQQD